MYCRVYTLLLSRIKYTGPIPCLLLARTKYTGPTFSPIGWNKMYGSYLVSYWRKQNVRALSCLLLAEQNMRALSCLLLAGTKYTRLTLSPIGWNKLDRAHDQSTEDTEEGEQGQAEEGSLPTMLVWISQKRSSFIGRNNLANCLF